MEGEPRSARARRVRGDGDVTGGKVALGHPGSVVRLDLVEGGHEGGGEVVDALEVDDAAGSGVGPEAVDDGLREPVHGQVAEVGVQGPHLVEGLVENRVADRWGPERDSSPGPPHGAWGGGACPVF